LAVYVAGFLGIRQLALTTNECTEIDTVFTIKHTNPQIHLSLAKCRRSATTAVNRKCHDPIKC